MYTKSQYLNNILLFLFLSFLFFHVVKKMFPFAELRVYKSCHFCVIFHFLSRLFFLLNSVVSFGFRQQCQIDQDVEATKKWFIIRDLHAPKRKISDDLSVNDKQIVMDLFKMGVLCVCVYRVN